MGINAAPQPPQQNIQGQQTAYTPSPQTPCTNFTQPSSTSDTEDQIHPQLLDRLLVLMHVYPEMIDHC